MSNKSWKQIMLDSLQIRYERKAIDWENEHNDKRIVSNTYFMIVEALESLPAEPNNYVKVAMHAHIREHEELMNSIIKRVERIERGEYEI